MKPFLKKVGKKTGAGLKKFGIKDAESSWTNGYTGKTLTNKMDLSVAAVSVGVPGALLLGPDFGLGSRETNSREQTEVRGLLDMKAVYGHRPGTIEAGEAPALMADGGSKSLGANGSMVFGMHNQRRG